MRTRRGQAIIEMIAGIFTIALLVSVAVSFCAVVTESLRIENHLREGQTAQTGGEALLDDLVAKLFGMEKLHFREPRGNVSREIPDYGDYTDND